MEHLATFSLLTFGFKSIGAISFIHEKIIWGEEIEIAHAPYHVAIEFGKNFRCGGSIISDTYILTTANCMDVCFECQEILVRTGASFRLKQGKVIPVKKVFIHPKWNRDTFDYDVAVLELIKPIPFDENSGPIELTSILPPPGKSVELIGWGKTEPFGCETSDVLKAVRIPLIDSEKCNNEILSLNVSCKRSVTTRMFCTGSGRENICNGEPGSPVTFNRAQIGIVSWASLNQHPVLAPCGKPNVYVKIADKEIWTFIHNHLNISSGTCTESGGCFW